LYAISRPFPSPARDGPGTRPLPLHLPPSSPLLKSISSFTAQTLPRNTLKTPSYNSPATTRQPQLASHNSPATIRQPQFASYNSQETRQSKTSRTTISNAQDPNARNENPGIKRLRKRLGTSIKTPRKRQNKDPGTKRPKTRASTP
jgi:hypothetical protein